MEAREQTKILEKNAIEAAIKIGSLGTMIYATFRNVQPFIMPVLWGIIIAVAVEPLVGLKGRHMRGRRKTSVLLFTSSFDTVQSLVVNMEQNTLSVPHQPERVRELPIIGDRLHGAWSQASTDFQGTMHKFMPQLKKGGLVQLGTICSGIQDVFMFISFVAIAEALLVILIGALGGMMMSGIIGLFVGAVVVTIRYSLFMDLVEEDGVSSSISAAQENVR